MKTRSLAGIAALSLVLAGCSIADQARQNNENDGQAGSSEQGGQTTEPTAGGTDGTNGDTDDGQRGSGTVTVLTHDSFALSDELRASFESETGYTLVTTAPGDSGMVINQLILNKDAPRVDAVYGIDSFSAQRAIDEGVIADYTPANDPGAEYREGPLTAIDIADVCVNYDIAWFEEYGIEPPTSYLDLATETYAPLLVVQNPATSATGLSFFIGSIWEIGESWQSYWGSLLHAGVKVSDSWSDSYYTDFSGADGGGQFPLVVSYASSPAESGGATGIIEGTCVRQIEYAGVVAGGSNEAGAQAFIDFMLSDDVQRSLPESMYVYPVADVELPEAWAAHAALPADPIIPEADLVGQSRDQWIRDWTDLFESIN